MRLVILQFGNYAEAVHRFEAGGEETFYAQRYSVEFVASLAARCEDLTVFHLTHDDPEERLSNGVRSLGIDLYPAGRRPRNLDLVRRLARLRPSHLVLMSPITTVLLWTMVARVRTLPMFADSFLAAGMKAKVRAAFLARLLNSRRFDWVSNHNLAASLDLARIGVNREKILPFDWPALNEGPQRGAKSLRSEGDFRVIFVGQVNEAKGVGDLIDAIGLLNSQAPSRRFRATIVGGHDGSFTGRAQSGRASGCIEFAGRVPHDRIVPMMNEHDAVVVASRHECAEGLPMTIYEGLCSRTPVVASDHPMFRFKLKHGHSALIFAAGSPASIAENLRLLSSDPATYSRLSTNAADAEKSFFCPLKYAELITRWLSGTEADRRELESYSLASGRYPIGTPDA